MFFLASLLPNGKENYDLAVYIKAHYVYFSTLSTDNFPKFSNKQCLNSDSSDKHLDYLLFKSNYLEGKYCECVKIWFRNWLNNYYANIFSNDPNFQTGFFIQLDVRPSNYSFIYYHYISLKISVSKDWKARLIELLW